MTLFDKIKYIIYGIVLTSLVLNDILILKAAVVLLLVIGIVPSQKQSPIKSKKNTTETDLKSEKK